MKKPIKYYLGRMIEGKLTETERKEYNEVLKKEYQTQFGKKAHAKRKFTHIRSKKRRRRVR